jgi:hypothetical protein
MFLKYFILSYIYYQAVVMHASSEYFVDVLVYPFVLYVAVLSSSNCRHEYVELWVLIYEHCGV